VVSDGGVDVRHMRIELLKFGGGLSEVLEDVVVWRTMVCRDDGLV